MTSFVFSPIVYLLPGVGKTFFQGVQGVDLVLELRGVSGVDFGTQKLTNFDQNCNFSLIRPKSHLISLNLTELTLI